MYLFLPKLHESQLIGNTNKLLNEKHKSAMPNKKVGRAKKNVASKPLSPPRVSAEDVPHLRSLLVGRIVLLSMWQSFLRNRQSKPCQLLHRQRREVVSRHVLVINERMLVRKRVVVRRGQVSVG